MAMMSRNKGKAGEREIAALLAEHGWLRQEVVPAGASGGRPSERYVIHPTLLNGGEA